MAADSTHEPQAAKRIWVVLLCFYLAALIAPSPRPTSEVWVSFRKCTVRG